MVPSGAVSFTLGNTYRISFTKTNISSPSASYVDVAYGGSTTVTVTPSSGYYLSTFSGCPSGWSCTGVSTGTSYTGNQTLTLTNNSSVNTGTITLTGTISHVYTCTSPWNGDAGSTHTYSGVQYICLLDGHWWTKNSQGATNNRSEAIKLCPSSTTLPDKAALKALVSKYSFGGLNDVTGWSGTFWSSTEYGSTNCHPDLFVSTKTATVDDTSICPNGASSYKVVCYR